MSEPLKIYDVQHDMLREATQEDIDRLERKCRELFQIVDAVRRLTVSRPIGEG